MMANKKFMQGFTIIELLLAMSFLTFVLLFVVTTTVQVLRTYNKGLTIKEINQSSRTILDQMSRDIATSSTVKIVQDPNVGRLCTKSATYVWNTVTAPDPPSATRNLYVGGAVPLYLVRSTDPAACGIKNKPDLVAATATELLGKQANLLNLSGNFVPSSNNKLYNLTISLGTVPVNKADLATVYEDLPKGICAGGLAGEFCAAASFSTTIYVPEGK